MNFVALQGTQVLEDREIRLNFCSVAEGSPPQWASSPITKYTGALTAPEWEDVEPGRVFNFPRYLVKMTRSEKDKFETLCRVKADISSAPYTTNCAAPGRTGYRRVYDIILLMGLTELKAQVSWIDSRTVRAHIVLHVFIHLTRLPSART